MSGLCSVKLEFEAYDEETLKEQESLVQKFVKAAQDEGNAIHLARALSMEAIFFAQRGNFERALQDQQVLQMVYKMARRQTKLKYLNRNEFLKNYSVMHLIIKI